MVRIVGVGGGAFLLGYAVLSLVTGQQVLWLGDVAQLVPPLAFAALSIAVARRSSGQARVFWHLNAAHGALWATGQVVWTYFDLVKGGVPVVSPTDPIFFASSLPLAAALYGRPDRDRPRWLFDIVLLDLVLIGLFAAFVYIYFVVSVAVVDGTETLYSDNLTQLLNARNLLLALWAAYVWLSATAPTWKRVFAIYAVGLAVNFLGGISYDVAELLGGYDAGALWDLGFMVPYVVLSLAAADAYDRQVLAPADAAPPLSRLPVVSQIAIALLVAIPAIDEVSRRLFSVVPEIAAVRTRLALAMMIPFGLVVVLREALSRRALLRSGQELESTREQLVQKERLAAVGQLVSGVAHELNNPLQGVLGYAELMLATRTPAGETTELKAIRDNANRAAGIVRNLLTFAGESSSNRSWQQMNGIVRAAVALRTPHLQAQDTTLAVQLADRLPLVYVDESRLTDVIANLIQNAEAAIAARRAGTVVSRVPRRAPGEINVSTTIAHDPDRILIEVADNGSGVKDEDLARVFEPFFTTREVGTGTGLGLSVCYGIIREHGGRISAHNADGGAVFTIELPVTGEVPSGKPAVTPAAAAAAAPPVSEAEVGPRKRALVVDDEESNAALVRRVLAGAGYDVESTTLSRRALVMMERTTYDCVIADVKMPELSGQELYTRVCQMRPEMAHRFIFITGDIDGENTRVFLEQSGCSYFMKPFNLERLLAAVDRLTGAGTPEKIG